jgi:transcriptional regulator with GAF, ATPase, and Fis domain
MGKRIEQVDPACMQELVARRWPGNIRELRHVIERAMILCDGPVLLIAPETTDGSGRSAASTRSGRYPGDPGEAEASEGNPGPTGQSGSERKGESGAPSALSTLDALQADHIRRVLAATNGIVDGPRGAAQILGLNPSTLRFRMKRLGIRVPRP